VDSKAVGQQKQHEDNYSQLEASPEPFPKPVYDPDCASRQNKLAAAGEITNCDKNQSTSTTASINPQSHNPEQSENGESMTTGGTNPTSALGNKTKTTEILHSTNHWSS